MLDITDYKLLQRRIAEFNIPEWPGQALFERILVYKIPDEASARETFVPDGKVIKPDMSRETQKARSPRGVVVSAGLGALEVLRDHGMTLGELVWIAPHVVYAYEVNRGVDGKKVEFFFMNVGDIVLSEDVLGRIVNDGLTVATSASGSLMYTTGKTTSDSTAIGTVIQLDADRRDPAKAPDDI